MIIGQNGINDLKGADYNLALIAMDDGKGRDWMSCVTKFVSSGQNKVVYREGFAENERSINAFSGLY